MGYKMSRFVRGSHTVKAVSVAVMATVSLVACQSNSVSLKEAEDIALEFETSSFTPPPRSIVDITSQLPMPTISPTAHLAEHCQGEDDGKWVARFKEYLGYYAPEDLVDQEVTDTGLWGVRYAYELYRAIGIQEIRRGNLPEAGEAFKQYIAKIPSDRKGAKIAAYAQYAVMLAGMGDLDAAEDALNQAEFWENEARNRPINKIAFHDHWMYHARGAIALGYGKLRTAEKHFRESWRNISEAKWYAPEVAIKHGLIAEALAGQGRLLEAENELRLGIRHNIKNGRMGKVPTAAIIYRLARVLLDQGRVDEAENAAASAVGIYQDGCIPAKSVEFAEARRTLAEIYAIQGRYQESLAIFEAIQDAMGAGNKVLDLRFGGDLTWANALVRTGKADLARLRLQASLKRLRDTHGEKHPKVAESIGFLAVADAALGKQADAEAEFKQSLAILDDPKQRTGVRPNNLRLIIEGYLGLLKDRALTDRQAADTMFRLVESLRGSTVQEAVASMGSRAAAGNPALAKLLRKEQDLGARQEALAVTYNNAILSGGDANSIKADAERLRLAQQALLEEINKRFPQYAELSQPKPLTLDAAQQLLNPGEALIVTYAGDDESYAWAIPQQGEVAFTQVPLGREALAREVKALRDAMAPKGPRLSDIPDFDLKRAYALYGKLLAPLESAWKGSDSLLIVADGPLGYLPFGTLPTSAVSLGKDKGPVFSRYREVPWLIKSHAVANLPSASALKALRSLGSPSPNRKPMIGFGDPLFNEKQLQQAKAPQLALRGGGQMAFRAAPNTLGKNSAGVGDLPRLPDTAEELREIAAAIGADSARDLRLGKDANEAAVKSTDLTAYRTVVFATHGLVPGELDGLTQPALALSAPGVAGVEGDGLLTMDEVMGLNLDADWVVLSACNTGSGDGAGAEAVSGLGRAFFYAGARSLLVSNWPVETTSARRLTSGIFSQDQSGRAAALRSSMLSLIEEGNFKNPKSGKAIFAYAHPIFWAPFSLMGDGAAGR